MFETSVVLDKKVHEGYRFLPVNDFTFARGVVSAPLAASEVVKASREFPIVFPTSGRLIPIAQMGYQNYKNNFVSEDGEWTARYTPAHLRRYPFVLGERNVAGKYVIMVNLDALTTDESVGEPLFENGEIPEGGIVSRARQFLVDFHRELEQTEALLKPLKDADILVPKTYTISQGEKTLGKVGDLQVVDTEKLAALDDTTLAGWVRSGLMGLVMAHLHSLDNWSGQKAFKSAEAGAA